MPPELLYPSNLIRLQILEDTENTYIQLKKDKKLFKTIYEKLYLSVYYFACRFVSSEDAEDITAECFLKLWKSDLDYNVLPQVKNWLQVCARNSCLMQIRDQKKRMSDHKKFLYLFEEQSDSDQEYLIREELLERLMVSIEGLPSKCQLVFKMAYLEGQTSQYIADSLHLSISTVSNHRLKALKLLRLASRDFTWLFFLVFIVVGS